MFKTFPFVLFFVCRRVLPNSSDLLERPMFRLVIYLVRNACMVFMCSPVLVSNDIPPFVMVFCSSEIIHFLYYPSEFSVPSITLGWRAKETRCAVQWSFCQGSDKQWPNSESLEDCWSLVIWTHHDLLRVRILLQCILVSEEDEEAIFVEASSRGRCCPTFGLFIIRLLF